MDKPQPAGMEGLQDEGKRDETPNWYQNAAKKPEILPLPSETQSEPGKEEENTGESMLHSSHRLLQLIAGRD